MKSDIQNREDIEYLVNEFYDLVQEDDLLGPVFNDVAAVNWIEHLPKMYRFWETILLDRPEYKGSIVAKHLELNYKSAIEEKHFNRWLVLWKKTITNNFKGARADEAFKRADYMAMLMKYKIDAA